MQHLTPVRLSEDGTKLILVSDTGEEFAVPVDHRFRSALRGDQARLGQETKMESALRPRDIQARIRAGETAEAVAAAAQSTVEGIMAFAAPVLAERAHVAQTAQKSSIRRTAAEASPVARTLDEACRIHFSTISVRSEDVEWDAWRREDGRWTVVAEYIAGEDVHHAEFSYDQPGRYVLAENDEARLLTGETTPAAPPAAPAAEPARRLSTVPTGDVDELPLGDDAIALVRSIPEPSTQVVEETDESTVSTSDLSEAAAAVRETPAPVDATFDDLVEDHADADWIAATPGAAAASDDVPVNDAPEPADDEPAEDAAAADQPAKKKGRSSVPSWDEIMFGGGKHE